MQSTYSCVRMIQFLLMVVNTLGIMTDTSAVRSLLVAAAACQVNLVDFKADVTNACNDELTVPSESTESGCAVGVSLAPGNKCERCWYQCHSVGRHHHHPTLCSRCNAVVEQLGVAPPTAASSSPVAEAAAAAAGT